MLVLRMRARPAPAKMMPPGPGMGPTTSANRSRITPRTNRPHSIIGLSMNFRHCSRVIMAEDVVVGTHLRKPLAGKVHSGLALLRRARGTSEALHRHSRE